MQLSTLQFDIWANCLTDNLSSLGVVFLPINGNLLAHFRGRLFWIDGIIFVPSCLILLRILLTLFLLLFFHKWIILEGIIMHDGFTILHQDRLIAFSLEHWLGD